MHRVISCVAGEGTVGDEWGLGVVAEYTAGDEILRDFFRQFARRRFGRTQDKEHAAPDGMAACAGPLGQNGERQQQERNAPQRLKTLPSPHRVLP